MRPHGSTLAGSLVLNVESVLESVPIEVIHVFDADVLTTSVLFPWC